MGLLSTVVEQVSDHPVLFIWIRSILENDFSAIRATIRASLSVQPGVRTLDLGCGPGAFSPMFDGGDYVGADLNARYIAYARGRFKGTFVVADARRVDLPAERFDQVLIFGLLHHLPDDDVRAVLLEAKRMLVAGGRLLVIEDIPAVSRMNLLGHLIHKVENGAHIRPAAAYRQLLQRAWDRSSARRRSGAGSATTTPRCSPSEPPPSLPAQLVDDAPEHANDLLSWHLAPPEPKREAEGLLTGSITEDEVAGSTPSGLPRIVPGRPPGSLTSRALPLKALHESDHFLGT